MESLFLACGGLAPIMAGTLGSLAAGIMTAVGAVPLLFFRKPGVQTQSALLGVAAGVMATAVLIGAAVIGLMGMMFLDIALG